MASRLPAFVITAILAPSLTVRADEGTPTPEPVPILGGDLVEPCGFPTAASMAGSCTGTLVHPRVVVYAAHCGDQIPTIRLSDTIDDPAGISTIPERCETHPIGQYGFGTDAAYCLLHTPIEDIPIAPPLMGCEAEQALQVGQPVTVVGFGNSDDEDNPYGIKRYLDTEITALSWDEVFIGGEDVGVCYGDSGGPTYTQLPDGSWRSFGITSWGQPGCGFGGYLSTITHNIRWIEESSGIDITPCHDSDGNWDPSPECTGFEIEPHANGGNWEDGCDFGEVSGYSASCGEAFDPDFVDEGAPTIRIVKPLSYSRIDLPAGSDTVKLSIEIEVDDGPGWGVGELELVIERDGQEQGRLPDTAAPFVFEKLLFAEGVWTLRAEGMDRAGNPGESEPVVIGIGVDPPPAPEPEPEPDDTGGEESSGGPEDAGDTGDTEDTDGGPSQGEPLGEEGCSCRSGGGPGSMMLLSLVVLGAIRRRRAAVGLSLLAAGCGDDIPDSLAAGSEGLPPGAATSSTGASDDATDADDDDGDVREDLPPPIIGCGNGIIEEDERCDDGNDIDGDGCSTACEPSGEVLASIQWPQDGPDAHGNALVRTGPDAFVAAGWLDVEDGGSAAILLGFDADLGVSWTTEVPGTDMDDYIIARSLAVDDTGAIWAAGTSERDVMDETIIEGWIARFDPDGTVQWSETIAGETNDERYLDVAPLPGGDAIAIGHTEFEDGLDQLVVRRHLAADGSVDWLVVGDVSAPETVALSVATNADAEIVVAGWTSNPMEYRDLFLRRYDDTGALLDSTIFSEPLTSYYPRAVEFHPDGDPVVCGGVVRASAENAMLGRFELGADPPTVWLQRLESAGQGASGCNGLDIAEDGRVAMAGFSFASETTFDHLIGRIDNEGEELWSDRVTPSDSYLSDFAEDVVSEEGSVVVVGGSQGDDNIDRIWIGRVRG